MATFHHHPDGLIYIRDDQTEYRDTVANFVSDSGRPYVGLPSGFIERFYDPGKTHYLSTGRNQANQNLTWEIGDTYIAELTQMLDAQHVRLTPPPPTFQELQNAKLAELNKAAVSAYVGGFYSSASGTKLWYDSDVDTQNVLNRQFLIALSTPEVYSSTVFFAGLPAGLTPVRARPHAADPDSAKTVQLISAVQMVQLGTDLAAAWAGVKGTLWGLQAKVYAATTADALAAINWPSPSN